MDNYIFTEKQYLGLNKLSLASRLALSLFCFFAYYWRENRNQEGELFFFFGVVIIVFSVVLFFILHFETKVTSGSIVLDGLWTARRIKINTLGLVSIKKVKYSKYLVNRAVYNLHYKEKIRFYTRGEDAVELTDKDGLIYLIGSQKSDELCRILNKQLDS